MNEPDRTDSAPNPGPDPGPDSAARRRPTLRDWLEGARLRTLPAAVAPVLLGAGAAYFLTAQAGVAASDASSALFTPDRLPAFSLGKSGLALLVALFLQIGVNFANDYSDGVRGTDDSRVGPQRLTASGVMRPRQVLALALGCFAAAALAGLGLVAWAGTWWMLLLGAAAVAAAWFYTGGRHPYGYAGVGLSELLVFVFFGLVACVGTAYVQVYQAPGWLWLAASALGLYSVSLLVVNNIRDIPTDRLAGKTTLMVRLGDRLSRVSYAAVMASGGLAGAAAIWWAAGSPVWGVATAAVLAAGSAAPVRLVTAGAQAQSLLPALRQTGLLALGYSLWSCLVFAVGSM